MFYIISNAGFVFPIQAGNLIWFLLLYLSSGPGNKPGGWQNIGHDIPQHRKLQFFWKSSHSIDEKIPIFFKRKLWTNIPVLAWHQWQGRISVIVLKSIFLLFRSYHYITYIAVGCHNFKMSHVVFSTSWQVARYKLSVRTFSVQLCEF